MGNTTSGYDESGNLSANSYQSSNSSRRSSLINSSTARRARAQTLGMTTNGIRLLNGGMKGPAFSRSLEFSNSNNNEMNRRKSTRDRQLIKENHYKNLVVKFDECVDGGYLAPYGVHDDETKLDYDDTVVRQLIIDRKLQPFYLPLEDYEEDELSDEDLLKILNSTLLHQPYADTLEKFENLPGVNGLTTEELNNSDNIDNYIDSSLSKNEKKIQKSLIFTSRLYKRKNLWQQKENERFLDAKAGGLGCSMVPNKNLLLDLYRNGDECPICFLYYPKNFNVSRCCQQPICSECFVQIKRKDPHYKNNHDDNNNNNNIIDQSEDTSEALVSECACCPYCATPDFGVTYEPPVMIKRSGLNTEVLPSNYQRTENINSDSSNVSKSVNTRPRTSSLPVNHESVVTSDMIRPDWETNLLKAKLRLKKRFAKANTIHMNNRLISTEEQNKIKKLEDEMLQKAIQLSLSENNK
ncbi:hypothetical protein ACO0SA_001283 [Hanseniaspora valbyensis]